MFRLFSLHVSSLAFLALTACATLRADVVINEFMSSNGATLADEEDSFQDWIELHNTGVETIDLGNWGLSDNNSNPFKWRFPAGTLIAPGGHLLVWASGKDRAAGADIPGIVRELWYGITGTSVGSLTNHPTFAFAPSSRDVYADFFEAPYTWRENYGQRLRGMIVAPATGNYRFWIASDDNSELRLSTDEDPANAVLIASVGGLTNWREWNKFLSQQSALIHLVEGGRYHIEALMKQGTGNDNLTVRWQLPDGTIEEPMSAEHIVHPQRTGHHTNFSISSSGEPLTLTRPNGTIADQVSAVSIPRDVSYGRLTDGGESWHFYALPTPGATNNSAPHILPPVVTISEPRGFRNSPFEVVLTSSEPGAVIRYTLDGSAPGPDSSVYHAPIPITGTSTLRAAVVGPGLLALPPATATWLFLDDILQQGSTPPPGWPASRAVNNHLMIYGMQQAIVTSDNMRLRQGMMDIPSISLVTDLDHLFAPNSGIYSYSNQSYGWERPASVELIDPQGNPESEFQIDIGLRLRGAYSRLIDNPKHAFRFLFRSAHGDRDLNFPLFEDEGPSSFKKVDLRTAQNYSWSFQQHPRNTFVREVFSRDTQRDMGMPYTRSRYYHLYLNGRYWGLYMTQERGDSDWAETYLGGGSDDWDNIKTSHPGYVTTATDGNNDAWHALHAMTVNEGFSGAFSDNYWRVCGLNTDGTPNPEYPAYVDQDNLIEYMLISHYTGDNDSPVSKTGMPNNVSALFNRVNPAGFTWLRHDAEHSLGARDGVTLDTTDLGIGETSQARFSPAVVHWRLAQHPEYRMRVADLMQKHVFGNGALTPANAKARVQSRMATIDLAIIAESARWRRSTTFTRDVTWINACNSVLSYLDQRRDIVVSQYRNRGWFPSINAPALVVSGPVVKVSSATPFYYMTDGSDPRLVGGGLHPQAVLAGGLPNTKEIPVHLALTLRARSYQYGEWSALSDGSLLEDIPLPAPIHAWNFEDGTTWISPSQTVGGGAGLAFTPGPLTEVLRNTAAQGFESAHLRVNNPLGTTIRWSLPTTGFGAIGLAFDTRRSGQGAGIQALSYTLDGIAWTLLESYTVFDAAPVAKSFDFSSIAGVSNNPLFAVRITFAQGGGGTAGNNRFDNFTLSGIALPGGEPPATLVFYALPSSVQSGATLSPVVVRLLDGVGQPAVSYNGPVTLSLSGAGVLTGTLTLNAVNGTATFDDLVVSGIGTYQLIAAADGLDPVASTTISTLSLTGLLVPRFIQGGQDLLGDNNERVPFAWLARIDGLKANATYRFANRVVLPSDTTTNDGAGNMIFVTSATENWHRTTSSPRFLAGDLGTGHYTFTTNAEGSFSGWFLTEPSGNARFTPGNQVHLRLLLNNGAGGESNAHILTTTESAQVIRFGANPGEGSAIIGESSTAARRLAVLYDDSAGATRPLAATPVEITGAQVDSRYASFYQNIVATRQSHWGGIIPNTLPGGLRRIEIRSSIGDASLLETRVSPSGFTGTINPTGGLVTPVLLDPNAGLPTFLPGGSATWHTASNWSNGVVPNATGAIAILNAPVGADRNININGINTTVGTLRFNQADTGFRNRLRTADGFGRLTFKGGAQAAVLRVEGAGGTGHVDLDFSDPITAQPVSSILATDLVLLVNQADGGDAQFGALRLQQVWAGPGGLIKQGPGMASLTGDGKTFTGPLVIEQGALRVTGPAVPAATSGVTIHPGGQLRLVSTGTAQDPRIHSFGGGAIQIGGMGRGGALPPGQELGVLGALRYHPGSQDNLATMTNPLVLTNDTDIHIDGTRNTLRLDAAITGNGHTLAKTGGGTLELSAASPAPAPPIDLQTGALAVNAAHPAAIALAADTILSGSGSVGAISGMGSVEPGAATLTASRSSAARIAAILTTPGGLAGNGALALTDATNPLPAAPQSIDLLLNPAAPLQPGDRFAGGIIVPAGIDLTSAIATTTITLFMADPLGAIQYQGSAYRQATSGDDLTWSVIQTPAGGFLEVLRSGNPVTYDQWRNLNFSDPAERDDPGISGPNSNSSGDGIANLLRYGHGVGPQDGVMHLLPRLEPAPGGGFAFRFRFDAAQAGLVWIVRASSDLTAWSAVLFDSRSDTPPAADPQGWTTLTVPLAGDIRFLRLELSEE